MSSESLQRPLDQGVEQEVLAIQVLHKLIPCPRKAGA